MDPQMTEYPNEDNNSFNQKKDKSFSLFKPDSKNSPITKPQNSYSPASPLNNNEKLIFDGIFDIDTNDKTELEINEEFKNLLKYKEEVNSMINKYKYKYKQNFDDYSEKIKKYMVQYN